MYLAAKGVEADDVIARPLISASAEYGLQNPKFNDIYGTTNNP